LRPELISSAFIPTSLPDRGHARGHVLEQLVRATCRATTLVERERHDPASKLSPRARLPPSRVSTARSRRAQPGASAESSLLTQHDSSGIARELGERRA
jgi:hypothetical protein